VRVAGPFTVESLSPHRVLTSRDDSLGDEIAAERGTFQRAPRNVPEPEFRRDGAGKPAHRGRASEGPKEAIKSASLEPWRVRDGSRPRAAIRPRTDASGGRRSSSDRNSAPSPAPDLTAAAREASEGRFEVLIACASPTTRT
jgi:adenine-specific DNA-methyltransferase